MPTEEPNRGNEAVGRARPEEGHGAVGITSPPASGDGRSRGGPQAPAAPPRKGKSFVKWLVLGAILIVAIPLALWFGIPWIIDALTTESTDDAYVNGYPTFVAPRVAGQVAKVFVVDNNQVHKGDLLVQLDKKPYQVVVDLKRANYEQAKADLEVTKDQVRGQVAMARGNRFKLIHTIEEVNNQIALLRANKAALDTTEARRDRAMRDYERAKELSKTPGAISQQELDLKQQDFRVAEAQVKQAQEAVYQVRVGLGLPAQPEKGHDLTEVPPNLDQTFSSVRQAAAELLQSAAPLGVFPSSYDLTPRQIIEEFYQRDPTGKGDVDRIYKQIIRDAPAVKQADAKLKEAEADLAQAELNLSYCNVYADIDGLVTRRNVNPGNNVQVGQNLMALRSPSDIWIDANFKETQLADLRIGQQVRIEVDIYGRHHTFEGRITGFTMGTGQTLSLLPPQNATGNFVKIVQRLPVRIELNNYDPERDPLLFIGASVEPHVYLKRPLIGNDPGKGKMLQPAITTPPPTPETKQ